MEIEDDFIEDSDKVEEEEEYNETNDNFFLTEAKENLHKETVLKPAVNIYPIASLAQQLISKMYSLEMFGQSNIGATVSGSVYDLSKHFKTLYYSFPSFIEESNVYAKSKEYALQRQFDSLKSKIGQIEVFNEKLRERIRNNGKRLPNLNKPNNDEFSEAEKMKFELKATAFSLGKSIERLKSLKQENDQFLVDNENIQKQIDSLLSRFKHKCSGEIGKIQNNIVKTEIEIKQNIVSHKENLSKAQIIVDSYNDPIKSLERRLFDMNRRISICSRPVRLPKISRI